MASIIYKVIKSEYYPYNNTEGDWEENIIGYFTNKETADSIASKNGKHTKVEKILAFDNETEEEEIKEAAKKKMSDIERMVIDGD